MSALVKVMNKEIEKYQGRIYYLEIRKDIYCNPKRPPIKHADWITDTRCYDHINFELHHIIKFTDYEHNKKWYTDKRLINCLILLPKVMHQHLENPVYELSSEDFYKKYLINKYELLFSKKGFLKGEYPSILKDKTEDEIYYDGCFDEVGVS